MPRYLVRFAKRGPLRFISHLDTIEMFKRAMRRADLPITWSKGNTPQMRIAILHPLPVGAESESEFLNIELDQALPVDRFVERLAPQLPEGVAVKMVRPVHRKLSFPFFDLSYQVEMEEGELPTDEQITGLLAKERIPVVRRKKGKERVDDVRPFLKEIRRQGDHLWMRLAAVDGQTVRPEEVLGLLLGLADGASPPCRILKLETTYGDR